MSLLHIHHRTDYLEHLRYHSDSVYALEAVLGRHTITRFFIGCRGTYVMMKEVVIQVAEIERQSRLEAQLDWNEYGTLNVKLDVNGYLELRFNDRILILEIWEVRDEHMTG